MRSGTASFWTKVAAINSLVATIQATGSSTVTGKLGNAQIITNNPLGAVYIAELPTTQEIQGSIVATSAGVLGTEFTVNFANLPLEGGPFRKSIGKAYMLYLHFSVSRPHRTSPIKWQLHWYTWTSRSVSTWRDTRMRRDATRDMSSW
jgi:hypothetical protein